MAPHVKIPDEGIDRFVELGLKHNPKMRFLIQESWTPWDYLDKRVGLQNVLITLSADHGFMNIPEYSASRNLDAGRIDPDKMIEATNAALSAKFGEGKYITAWWNPNLYVDYKLIESRKLNKVEVENGAQDFLREYPGDFVQVAIVVPHEDGAAQQDACDRFRDFRLTSAGYRRRFMAKGAMSD